MHNGRRSIQLECVIMDLPCIISPTLYPSGGDHLLLPIYTPDRSKPDHGAPNWQIFSHRFCRCNGSMLSFGVTHGVFELGDASPK